MAAWTGIDVNLWVAAIAHIFILAAAVETIDIAPVKIKFHCLNNMVCNSGIENPFLKISPRWSKLKPRLRSISSA
jgi:hypothetical protein